MTETIAIDKIDRGAGTQSRAGLHGPTVYDYAEAMEAGDHFPPIDLIYDGANYYLKDGFHRVAAAVQAGLKTFEANVEQGTLQDAQWASYAVNATHGLRRSREDTRRAIIAALKHPNGAGKSNREIARHVGVDHVTVGTCREQLQSSGEIHQIETRQVERKGSTYTQNTSNIGASQSAVAPLLEERFPIGSYVYLKTARLRKVCAYQNDHLLVSDPMLPSSQVLQEMMIDKTARLATEAEIDAYCFPPFPVGSKVVVEGSTFVHTVMDTMIGYVSLLSVSAGGKQPFTVRIESVHRAPEGQQSTPGFGAQRNALERAYLYRGNAEEGWHLYAFGNYQNRETLDLLVQDGLIEAEHYQTPSERLRITAKGCDLLGKPLASWMSTDDQPEWVYGDGTPLTDEDIEQRNADVAAAMGQGDEDDDGPYDNGTLDDYSEADEQPLQLPPAPYRVADKLHGGLAIFDAEGHAFMYFVGLSEEAEKQLGDYLVNTLNSVMSVRAE